MAEEGFEFATVVGVCLCSGAVVGGNKSCFCCFQSASMQQQPVADDLQGVGEQQVVTGNGSRQSDCPVPR